MLFRVNWVFLGIEKITIWNLILQKFVNRLLSSQQKQSLWKNKTSVMFKMVVSSQAHMTVMSDGKSESPELMEVKNTMKDFTKDIPLGRLEHEHAVEFLSSSLVRVLIVHWSLNFFLDNLTFNEGLLALCGWSVIKEEQPKPKKVSCPNLQSCSAIFERTDPCKMSF